MGKITDIAPQKRNKSRVSVFIDGEFVCGLDAVTALAARLAIGDEVTPDGLIAVVEASEVNSAFERAVSYIERAPRARRELERYLKDKGYEPNIVQKVIARMDSYGYTDDRAYAEMYIRSKSKKYGEFRIAADLRRKGIPSDIIDELLSGGGDAVIDVGRKYLRSHKSVDIPKLKRFLAGRGFGWDDISRAVDVLKTEMADDADENYDNYD